MSDNMKMIERFIEEKFYGRIITKEPYGKEREEATYINDKILDKILDDMEEDDTETKNNKK